jgi:exopolysaccharide biosynthesis polyprenyl glycosylphosphotransferase
MPRPSAELPDTVRAPSLSSSDARAHEAVHRASIDASSDSDHRTAVAAPWATPTPPARTSDPLSAWTSRYSRATALSDGLIGVLAVLMSIAVSVPFNGQKTAILALGAGLAWPLSIALCRGYERNNIGVGSEELRAVLRALVLAIAAGAVPSALTDRYGVLALSVLATPLAAGLSIVARLAGRGVLHRRQRAGKDVRRVIVVGSTYAADDLARVLAREAHTGMTVLGICIPKSELAEAAAAGLNVIGSIDQVPELARSWGADAVAVTGSDATRRNELRELAWALEGVRVELLVHPGLIEVAGPRMHIRPYVGLPLLHVEQPHFTGWRRFVKRATDLVLTLLGTAAISPLLALVALAIKLEDGGPVIFRQNRVGLDGTTFTMLKFRSMHVGAEAKLAQLRAENPSIGLMFKMEDDPRITRVGRVLRRFSLDELPQLFNVIAGHMSLVGPRPPLQSEVDIYENHARRRLLVTPGVTGLWQVSGRSLLNWEETVRLDLRYVENWTLTMDLLILWKTVSAVLRRHGAM